MEQLGPDTTRVSHYLRRLELMRQERSTWRDHWRDIADHLLPRRARFDPSDRWRSGSKKNQKIVNNTGTRALRILASGMMAGITSPARPWFRLRTSNPRLNRNRRVKQWLAEVERIMLEVFARSNVYNALANTYLDIGSYGTASMYLESHPRDVMRAHVMPIGSYFLGQDHHYRINSVYRETTLTVEQAVRRFGYENVTQHVRTLHDQHQLDTWIEYIHAIEPNDDLRYGQMDASGMKWRSVWIEYGGHVGHGQAKTDAGGGDDDKIAAIGGFQEFPAMCPRWMVTGEDVYGNSPGMDALGDIRALQHMERKRALALDKIVNPPMVGPGALRAQRTSLLAGDVTYLDGQGGRNKFEPAHVIDSRVTLLSEELNRHEERISAAFYADLFLMLASAGSSNMTAREVEERHEEKMLQLGPTLERLQDELLDPLIDRAYGILFRAGMLPEPPDELLDEDTRPEYISILAQAQKLIAIVGIERLSNYVVGMAEAFPEVRDKFDPDKAVDEIADMIGTAPELVRTDEVVAELRDQRAQQQQMTADRAKAAKDGTQAVKNMGEAVNDNPALAQMMSAMGAGGVIERGGAEPSGAA